MMASIAELRDRARKMFHDIKTPLNSIVAVPVPATLSNS